MTLLAWGNLYGVTTATASLRVTTIVGGIDVASTTPASQSGSAWRCGASSLAASFLALPSSFATGFLGFHLLPSLPAEGFVANNHIGVADSNGVIHLVVKTNVTGKLEVWRGLNGTLLATSVTSINNAQWSTVELGFFIDDSAGSVTLRFHTASGIVTESFTSLDTRNGGLASVGAIAIPGHSISGFGGTAQSWLDGFYICDNAGGAPFNTFLGDFRITSQFPASAGASTQWTPSTGNNWACTDENPHNSDTDYVESSTAGQRDLYNLTPFNSTATTIFAVRHLITGRYVTSSVSITPVLRSGATINAAASNLTLDNTYTEKGRPDMLVNPVSTIAWTVADMNALQVGADMV